MNRKGKRKQMSRNEQNIECRNGQRMALVVRIKTRERKGKYQGANLLLTQSTGQEFDW